MRTCLLKQILVFILLLATSSLLQAGDAVQATVVSDVTNTSHVVDPDGGPESWEVQAEGISVNLTQIGPDRARGFFAARGFTKEAAEKYAHSCTFETVVRNEGDTAIDLHVADWRALVNQQTVKPKLEPAWQSEWAQMKLSQAARIAFRWSQFPLQQHFEKGDWGQGMTTYPLPHGACFDLAFSWIENGKPRSGIIKGVCCAQDK
ncbi:MAG: hypothetical protein ACOH1I_12630 [Gallionellaceae bacterium]|jgi:hypothetical protein